MNSVCNLSSFLQFMNLCLQYNYNEVLKQDCFLIKCIYRLVCFFPSGQYSLPGFWKWLCWALHLPLVFFGYIILLIILLFSRCSSTTSVCHHYKLGWNLGTTHIVPSSPCNLFSHFIFASFISLFAASNRMPACFSKFLLSLQLSNIISVPLSHLYKFLCSSSNLLYFVIHLALT